MKKIIKYISIGFSLCLFIIVILGLWLWQDDIYTKESLYFKDRINWYESVYIKDNMNLSNQSLEDFESKLSNINLKIKSLNAIIPEQDTLNDFEFIEYLKSISSKHNVACKINKITPRNFNFYNSINISVELSGNKKDIQLILKKIESGERMVNWTNLDYKSIKSDQINNIEFAIYSISPAFGKKKKNNFTENMTIKTWLPPYAQIVKNLQKRTLVLQEDAKQKTIMTTKINFVEEYDNRNRHFEMMKDIIKLLGEKRNALVDN